MLPPHLQVIKAGGSAEAASKAAQDAAQAAIKAGQQALAGNNPPAAAAQAAQAAGANAAQQVRGRATCSPPLHCLRCVYRLVSPLGAAPAKH
jgi:hypothetical protein